MASKNASIGNFEFTGVLLRPVKLAWRFVLIYFSLGITCMFLCVTAYSLWWNNPTETLKMLLESSLESARWEGSTLASKLAALSSEFSYWIFFKFTLIDHLMDQLDNGPPLDSFSLAIAKLFFIPFQNEIHVSMVAGRIYGIRVGEFLMCIPMFIFAYVVGMVDGLVERYIRTACAGRESAGLYHRAKYAQMGTIALCLILFLLVPFFIDPRFLAPPAALFIGFFSRMQWKWYKKHL